MLYIVRKLKMVKIINTIDSIDISNNLWLWKDNDPIQLTHSQLLNLLFPVCMN